MQKNLRRIKNLQNKEFYTQNPMMSMNAYVTKKELPYDSSVGNQYLSECRWGSNIFPVEMPSMMMTMGRR